MTSCLLSGIRTSCFLRNLTIQRASLVTRGLALAPQICQVNDRQRKLLSVAFMSTSSSKSSDSYYCLVISFKKIGRRFCFVTLEQILSSTLVLKDLNKTNLLSVKQNEGGFDLCVEKSTEWKSKVSEGHTIIWLAMVKKVMNIHSMTYWLHKYHRKDNHWTIVKPIDCLRRS